MMNTKIIKQLSKILNKVKSHKEKMTALSDLELSRLTIQFKKRIEQGDTLDRILPEAYAAICEANYRVLGKFPYDVQILGAIALHQGKLIEMNTGEGKTLVATMPLYLNALTGKSTILLTTNEYLALRDCEELGPVYKFMGLSVAAGVQAKAEDRFTNEEKKKIYSADIVYTTHGVFGFDYLLNNLVTKADDRFLRELYYVIIDEADSVLLDSAQTPLVISGSPRVQSNLYEMADFFVSTLIEGRDFEKDGKKVWFTEDGIKYAESFFRIDNFYSNDNFEINRHVTLALRAHAIFEKEKEYVISKSGELQLLDNGSGRMMPGMKLRGGQHQAIEMKEKLEVSKENRSIASITYQNLFLLFPKLSGMSGTISDAASELMDVYGVDVVVIPPNHPLRRKDLKDLYFVDRERQFEAALKAVVKIHTVGQPVLIVVSTIAETELVSKYLIEEKIPHNVLNANNAFWEANIIKEAGQLNAVTVATSMAGRGTDIRLGRGVKQLGGLAVIGIGRMDNVRQERQARGRAGRQGDPGFSLFFVSIQDEVVVRNGIVKEKRYISNRRLKKIINSAQKNNEECAVDSRRMAMDYDYVLQRQREIIYATRNQLLDNEELGYDKIMGIAQKNIKNFLRDEKRRDVKTIYRYILDNIAYSLDNDFSNILLNNDSDITKYFLKKIAEGLAEQEEKLGSREQLNNFMRMAILQAVDDAWVEQVDYLQQLQAAVLGRVSAQRNVLFEYQKDALESFKKMEKMILRNIIRNILLSNVYVDREQKINILLP